MRIKWLPGALAALVDAHAYIAAENPKAAANLVKRIKHVVSYLAENPLMGRKGRKPETRELMVAGTPYLIVYAVMGGEIVIVRLIHTARLYP
jgi:toxin ParE1/3/4